MSSFVIQTLGRWRSITFLTYIDITDGTVGNAFARVVGLDDVLTGRLSVGGTFLFWWVALCVRGVSWETRALCCGVVLVHLVFCVTVTLFLRFSMWSFVRIIPLSVTVLSLLIPAGFYPGSSPWFSLGSVSSLGEWTSSESSISCHSVA